MAFFSAKNDEPIEEPKDMTPSVSVLPASVVGKRLSDVELPLLDAMRRRQEEVDEDEDGDEVLALDQFVEEAEGQVLAAQNDYETRAAEILTTAQADAEQSHDALVKELGSLEDSAKAAEEDLTAEVVGLLEPRAERFGAIRVQVAEIDERMTDLALRIMGAPKMPLPSNRTILNAFIFLAVLALAGVVEMLLGIGMFRYESDAYTALGLSVAIILGGTALFFMAAWSRSILNNYRTAERRLEQTKRRHPKYKSLELFLPSEKVRFIHKAAHFMCYGLTLLILFGRGWLVYKSEAHGLVDFLGTCALFGVMWGFYLLEVWLANYFVEESAEYNELEKERHKLQVEMNRICEPFKDKVLMKEAGEIFATYQNRVGDAYAIVLELFGAFKAAGSAYRRLAEQYASAPEFFLRSFERFLRLIGSAANEAEWEVEDLTLSSTQKPHVESYIGKRRDRAFDTSLYVVPDEDRPAEQYTNFGHIIRLTWDEKLDEARARADQDVADAKKAADDYNPWDHLGAIREGVR